MGELIYSYGRERFGVKDRKAKKEHAPPDKSRRQQEIERLVKERRQLKKQWKKTNELERGGLEALQCDIKQRLVTLRRAEYLRRQRRKKERARVSFYKNPFKFTKSLFVQEKSGTLKAPLKDIEEFLKNTYSEADIPPNQRHGPVTVPADMPPLHPPKHEMDTSAPTWNEPIGKTGECLCKEVAWATKMHEQRRYVDGPLSLPISSLTEEYKCAKSRLEMTLSESRDPLVCCAAPALRTGRKWNPKAAVADARAALRHRDIIGHVQQGRGGFGLGAMPPTWGKASPAERRCMVVEEIRRQEEAARYARAVSQPQQGRWMRWNGTAKKKISWSELWSMESNRLSFIIKATYDILPTPANLHLWLGEDPACPLCSAPAGLKHILVGCKTSLSQGRYTWRHNQVLRCLASAIEEKRTATNAAPPNVYPEVQTPTAFIREAQAEER
ncbi:hypothetical protein MHYP_G00289400 [Metynnis hypsauchen]